MHTASSDVEGILSVSASLRKQRRFLFLQGHPSAFWARLGDGLQQDGHRVWKVHLSLADRIYWGRRDGTSYRGALSKWPAWLAGFLDTHDITDIVYYTDQLPYHRQARALAEPRGVACWALEFGYLRPDWLTLEAGGMGAFSTFPRDPERLAELAAQNDAPDMRVLYPHGFATEAFHEVSYHLIQSFGRPAYPRYVADKIYWPIVDYLSWLPELLRAPRDRRNARALQARVAAQEFQFNLVALQLQADYQIRASSGYDHISDFLDEVMASFARHAPGERHLVIKIHPLDNGIERWFRTGAELARSHGLSDRVHIIKGGDLPVFVKHCAGVVTINSTVGLQSLRQAKPTLAMGTAIYDLDGLTHRAGLDRFWTDPQPPQAPIFQMLERALRAVQVKGSFFNRDGQQAAIAEIRARFAQDTPLRAPKR